MGNGLTVMASDIITVRFGWNAYPKKYSGGLISGLIASNTIIDCDARAFFCDKDGNPVSDTLNEACVFSDNTSLFDNAASFEEDLKGNKEKLVLNLNEIPEKVSQIVLTLDLFKVKGRVGLGKIQESYLKIFDRNGEELGSMSITNVTGGTKIVNMGRFQRNGTGWLFSQSDDLYDTAFIREYIGLK